MGRETSPLIIAVLVISLIILFLFAVFGGYLIKPGDGYGVYSPIQEGLCQDGMRITIQECIPNVSNGRGCINDSGIQSYAPKIKKEKCQKQQFTQIWSQIDGDCVNTSPNPNNPIYKRTNTKTCISTGIITGTNGCLNTEPLQTGVIGIIPYNIGDTITWEENCFPLTPIVPAGVWESNGSSTPIFNTQLNITGSCLIDSALDPKLSLLTEGYDEFIMSCSVTDGCLNLLPNILINAQTCNPTLPPPSEILDKSVPEDINPIICTSSSPPELILPCRLRPNTVVDFGFGTDMNILCNSWFLITIPNVNPLIFPYTVGGLQTPTLKSNPQRKRFFNWGQGTTSDLADTNLIYIDPTTDTRSRCSDQQISFDTGILGLIAPRNITSPNTVTGIITFSIPSSYQGWMKTIQTQDGEISLWTQASAAYISPGLFSNQAQQFNISILSSYSSTIIPGYPTGNIGSIRVRIRTINNGPILVPSIGTIVGGSTPEFLSLEDVTLILFDLNTNIESRVIGIPSSCNLISNTL